MRRVAGAAAEPVDGLGGLVDRLFFIILLTEVGRGTASVKVTINCDF
jgi:hypothetical protein